MKRKHSDLLLEVLATASTLFSFYTCNPIVAIAATPLAIYCLVEKYAHENEHESEDENEEQ